MRVRLICYDIHEDKIRHKVADMLLKYGCLRLQRSVFVGRQKEEDFYVMKEKIEVIMAKAEDTSNTIYYIIVSQEMLARMHHTGPLPDMDMILDKQTFMWI